MTKLQLKQIIKQIINEQDSSISQTNKIYGLHHYQDKEMGYGNTGWVYFIKAPDEESAREAFNASQELKAKGYKFIDYMGIEDVTDHIEKVKERIVDGIGLYEEKLKGNKDALKSLFDVLKTK